MRQAIHSQKLRIRATESQETRRSRQIERRHANRNLIRNMRRTFQHWRLRVRDQNGSNSHS